MAVIKPLLKAPLTAVLCSREELSITTDGNGNYTIIGYVNSQNSYGAMIKTGFRATAVQANGNWQLLNVKLENQAGKNLAASWLIGILITIITFAFFYFIYSSFLF